MKRNWMCHACSFDLGMIMKVWLPSWTTFHLLYYQCVLTCPRRMIDLIHGWVPVVVAYKVIIIEHRMYEILTQEPLPASW